MNDLISRQAAIDAFWKLDVEIRPSAIDAITKMLEELPAAQPEPSQVARDIATIMENEQDMRVILAQPERMRGRWKQTYLDHVAMGERPHILYCSACNQCIAYPTNFCPNCGSYNGGEQE